MNDQKSRSDPGNVPKTYRKRTENLLETTFDLSPKNARGSPGRVDVSAHAREKIYAHLDVSVSCAAGCAPIDDFVWEHERKESRGTWTSHAKHRRRGSVCVLELG